MLYTGKATSPYLAFQRVPEAACDQNIISDTLLLTLWLKIWNQRVNDTDFLFCYQKSVTLELLCDLRQAWAVVSDSVCNSILVKTNYVFPITWNRLKVLCFANWPWPIPRIHLIQLLFSKKSFCHTLLWYTVAAHEFNSMQINPKTMQFYAKARKFPAVCLWNNC